MTPKSTLKTSARRRPGTDEHHEYYTAYIGCVKGDVLGALSKAPAELRNALCSNGGWPTPEVEARAYAPGKWNLREVMGHVVDVERLFAFRSLHIARNDPSDLPGMDQDIWARHSNAGERPLRDLYEEFCDLRAANVRFFSSLANADWDSRGTASGSEVTVRALAWIMAGHEIHHRNVILKRYLDPNA